MRKKEIIKRLKTKFNVNTKLFGDYDFEVKVDTKSYFVKVLNISSNHQITINSKLIWNLKKGVISGIRFRSVSSSLLNFKEFNKLENKIVMLTSKPYKLLKFLNESDLKDISDEREVNGIFITYDFDELIAHLNK